MSVTHIKTSIPTLMYAVCWALYLSVAASSPSESSIHVIAPLGIPESKVIQAVRQEIREAAVKRRDQEYQVNTTFDKAWDNAVLLQLYVNHRLFL